MPAYWDTPIQRMCGRSSSVFQKEAFHRHRHHQSDAFEGGRDIPQEECSSPYYATEANNKHNNTGGSSSLVSSLTNWVRHMIDSKQQEYDAADTTRSLPSGLKDDDTSALMHEINNGIGRYIIINEPICKP
jgi:adenosyl cobinamide kinase/adenosyl cobinamide phosphate guanylyltransferase